MDYCAPLNLAHFHERRADKLLKRHQYDEAYKAVETALLYIQDAHRSVHIPKALHVLNTQKWDYERKLMQIRMRKQQYDRLKQKEIVPSAAQNENNTNIKTETVNAQSIARSIDKTIKEFNDKYGSTSLMVNMQRLMLEPTKENQDPNKCLETGTTTKNDETIDDSTKDICKRRLSILDEHLQSDEDLPSLAPLELPSFDYSVFMSSGLVENFQK